MTLAETVGQLRRTLNRTLARRVAEDSARPLTHLLALRALTLGQVQTQSDLCERLLIDAPAASRLVDRLASDGLLERCDAQDRRCVRLVVTAAGKREIRPLARALEELERQVADVLGEAELRRAYRVLNKLQTSFGAKKVSRS